DAFAAQLARHEDIVDADGVARDLHRQHRHEVTDELADQAEGRGLFLLCICCKKAADGIRVAAVNGTDEEPLPAHATSIVTCGYSISIDIGMRQIILDFQ